MMKNVISIDRISKTYGKGRKKNTVYQDFSLFVPKSSHLICLTGPDGAGKSTLLKLLCGIQKPDCGTIRLGEYEPDNTCYDFTVKVGYMSQTLGLYEELTVLDNLKIFSGLKDVLFAEHREFLFNLLEKAGLSAFKDFKANSLSGGMKQKLGLICALSSHPEFLLLDEPTVGVDPVSRGELWEIIFAYLKEYDATCIFSTAYLEEATASDLVVLLNCGQIVKMGGNTELCEALSGRTYSITAKPEVEFQTLARTLMFHTRHHDRQSPILDLRPRLGRIELLAALQTEKEQILSYLLTFLPLPWRGALKITERECSLEDVYIDATFRPANTLPLLNTKGLSRDFKSEPTIIDVRGIQKKFGTFTAVSNSSFTVHRGEIFGLLGPNGAGKTTTFRMMCALLAPTEGTVLIFNQNLRQATSDIRESIGYVSQKFSLYGKLTVLRNLKYFGQSYALHGAALHSHIEELLDEFSLRDYADALSCDLPFGIQRQLSMACALIHKPKILFLDEATSGADPCARRNFWQRICALAANGTSVIVTTHFMDEAEYCDRFLIQDKGRIIALGTPQEICYTQEGRVSVEQAFIRRVRNFRQEYAS